MKRIQVIVEPFRLEPIQRALESAGIYGITFEQVRDCRHEQGRLDLYRDQAYLSDLPSRVEITVVVTDDTETAAIEAIRKQAGEDGSRDSSILISPVTNAVRIRTGEQGEAGV